MMDVMQLLLWCAAFICICGKDKVSSCDVEITVHRGTTKYVSAGQSLTVKCPVKHCGKLFSVTWCKLSNRTNCEHIPVTQNVEIRQENKGKNLISYLKFKQVSINDDGLYKCHLESNNEIVAHSINISVSDLNKVVKNLENGAVGSNAVDEDEDDDKDNNDDDDGSWLQYFLICISIVLLITTVIVLTLVCLQGWKRIWTCKNKNQEKMRKPTLFTVDLSSENLKLRYAKERSTNMIPELHKTSAPSSPILQTQFSVLNDIYSSSKVEGTTSPSTALIHNGNLLAVANTTANVQVSSSALYTDINHQHCGTPARKFTSKQDEKTNYAVINVT